MTRLSPCPACDRHVHAASASCPFCESELAEGFAAPIYRPTQRLGRAAMLAFRTLVIGAAGASVGCGASTGLAPPDDTDAGVVDAAVVVDSGRPSIDAGFDGGIDAGFDAGFDAGGVIAAYGGPIFEDAGPDATIGPSPVPAYGTPAPLDAGPEDADVPTGNLYGSPPIPG